MKKVLKISFIYLGVLLFALIAAAVFCAAFLFFYREGNIFGYRYISVDKTIYAKTDKDLSDVENIIINSETFDVYVTINNNVDLVSGAMRVKVFGYAKESKAHASISVDYNNNTKSAIFNADQPSGWLNKNKSYVEIAIPKDWAERNVNISVKTNKGKVKIGSEEDLLVGNFNLQTNKSKIYLTNLDISSGIDVSIGSGTISIDKKCTTINPINANISLGSGKVYFGEVDVEKFLFNDIKINKISSGLIQINKANKILTTENINGGGKIQILETVFIDFSSLDTDIEIKNITGNQPSRIIMTGMGDVDIRSGSGDLIVNVYNGNVYVGAVGGSVSLSSNKGNIKMYNALKLVSAVSNKGNIDIEYSKDALNYSSSTSDNRAVMATTKNGHIRIKGLQNGHIVATENGRISLEYDKVVGDNQISAKSGMVEVIVPNPSRDSLQNEFAFNLSVESGVNSDVKVGVAGSIGKVEYIGSGSKNFNNIYNSASSTSNNLNIKSVTGFIKVRSMDLIGF